MLRMRPSLRRFFNWVWLGLLPRTRDGGVALGLFHSRRGGVYLVTLTNVLGLPKVTPLGLQATPFTARGPMPGFRV